MPRGFQDAKRALSADPRVISPQQAIDHRSGIGERPQKVDASAAVGAPQWLKKPWLQA
jgi:hypothetical protein